MLPANNIRVHVIEAGSGKVAKRKTYTRPSHAARYAENTSTQKSVRECMVFTGDGKTATLVYRRGLAVMPAAPGVKARHVEQPVALLKQATTNTATPVKATRTAAASKNLTAVTVPLTPDPVPLFSESDVAMLKAALRVLVAERQLAYDIAARELQEAKNLADRAGVGN